ncbi:MAG: hypothetical protein OEX03_06845 [Gammaproteobacteria bacterium]|nr:hypothetical protein [Gammaproteobacteria bacterium]
MAPSVDITIQGRVTDSTAVSGVLVSSGTSQTLSDENGFYELRGVDVKNKEQAIVSFSKVNYAPNQKVLSLNVGMNSYGLDASLSPYDLIERVDAGSSLIQQVSLPDPANPALPPLVKVEFPVGSIPSSGITSVSVKRGDPTSAEGKAIFPGPYLGIASAKPNLSPYFIESVVFTEITLQELGGDEITRLNKPATVTLRLPQSLQNAYRAGDTIPWWSYNEEMGIWVREDAEPATAVVDDAEIISLSGLLYARAKASHFSWWNVDKPVNEHACLCAEVVDQDDNPLKNIGIVANGITYNAASALQYTSADGKVCMTVKRTLDINQPAKVELHAEYGTLRYHYQVTDPDEGIVNTSKVYTPSMEGSTLQASAGSCGSLNNKFKLFLDGEIFGQVTDELGNPLPNFEFSSNLGMVIKTDADGRYHTTAPGGAHVNLFKPRLFSRQVDVSYTEPTEVNIVIENQPPWVQLFNHRKHNEAEVENQWLVTVLASDPEGGAVTYQWQADVGSITATGTPGSTAIFQAPNTASGTATITLTVTDPKGASTTVTREISWGMGVAEKTHLKIYFRDNKRNDQPIEGLIVSLYGDSGQIIQRYVSNGNGMIDAGDIGKQKVSFSVLVQNRISVFDLHPFSISNYMHTFMDVDVGDIIFYLDHYNSMLSASPSRVQHQQASAYASLNLSGVDTSAAYAWRANAKSNNKLATTRTGSDVHNIVVQDLDLNTDDELDLLSYVSSGNNDDILGYDYLLDQAVLANSSYVFDFSLTRMASRLEWIRPMAALDIQGSYNLRLYALRKGKLYSFTPFQRPTDATYPLQDSGSLTMLAEFPADRYVAEIYGYEPLSDFSFSGGYHYYPYPPALIELTEPQQRISAGRFSNSSFSWAISGSSDLTILKITPPGCALANFNSYVWMDGDSNNWTLMETPPEVGNCVSNASIRNAVAGYNGVTSYIDRFYVQRQDLDVVSSYSGLWSMLASGMDLEETAMQRSYVRHSFYTHEDAP